MPLREGLHEMMQCDMRQHFTERYWLHEHPGKHAPRREPTMRESTKESTTCFVRGPVCKWNVQKMRSESNEYVRKTTGFFTNSWRIKIALDLESYFEERAQETWERNLRKTTFLNMCNPILMETILKVLRDQFKDDDQRKTSGEIAGSVPETSLEWETIL